MFIAHCKGLDEKPFAKTVKSNTDILILIDFEGDFSPSEIEKTLATNFIPVTLGESRLHTETTSVVALQTVAWHMLLYTKTKRFQHLNFQ